jgi:hypothetical protein
MGLKEDRLRRNKLRTDDCNRRKKVEKSLKIIYTDGYAVNTPAVEELLQDESWVPTAVS